ncbi:MAG TPA: GntR family transcriptional regulator, partial [Anaerolineales bacterium]|nr:GntR family transcriptional regulator [Anaerolineales bacterium]
MENHLFRQITPQNVETEIFARLRAAIVSGKIKPGERLVETDIAKQMAVSRIPIREALSKLEQEGLVLRQPNKGCFVITFSEQDVLEVCSLRASLESMAFEWAIPKMTAQDIADLQALVERQERAIRMEDYDELAQLDMHFHEFICIKADHHRLLKAWYEQHAQCQMLLNLRFRQMAEYTPETVLVDHKRILAAIENNDPKAAIDLTLQISDR